MQSQIYILNRVQHFKFRHDYFFLVLEIFSLHCIALNFNNIYFVPVIIYLWGSRFLEHSQDWSPSQ